MNEDEPKKEIDKRSAEETTDDAWLDGLIDGNKLAEEGIKIIDLRGE